MLSHSLPNSFNVSFPDQYAIYLPAVNESYPKFLDTELDPTRRVPPGFQLADLEFWSGHSSLWNYSYILHSIGGYSVGSDPRGPLFRRAPQSSIMLGDSGGFQIGKGTLTGLVGLEKGMSGTNAVTAWATNYDAKVWIIEWLERYADYALTLDMPLWAMTDRGADSPFHHCDAAQLTTMTVDNLKLIEKLKQGRTRWLNVVQGSNFSNVQTWWQAVKWFRDGGWSLAGTAGWLGGLADVLRAVLMMRNDDAFLPGLDLVHVLGVSQTKWAIFLTAIQKELRKDNPNLQITYDSATPFKCGGRHDQYAISPQLGSERKDWGIRLEKLEQTLSYADSTNVKPFPASSPLGNVLSMHHLVIHEDEFKGRRIDSLTNMMLMNHNVWVYLDAMQRANQLAFGPTRCIPLEFAEALEVIPDIFAAQNGMDLINQHQKLLDQVAPAALNDPEVDMALEDEDL